MSPWLIFNCDGTYNSHSQSVHLHRGRTHTWMDERTGARHVRFWLVFDGVLTDSREIQLKPFERTLVKLPKCDDLEVYLIRTSIRVHQYKECAYACMRMTARALSVLVIAGIAWWFGATSSSCAAAATATTAAAR